MCVCLAAIRIIISCYFMNVWFFFSLSIFLFLFYLSIAFYSHTQHTLTLHFLSIIHGFWLSPVQQFVNGLSSFFFIYLIAFIFSEFSIIHSHWLYTHVRLSNFSSSENCLKKRKTKKNKLLQKNVDWKFIGER